MAESASPTPQSKTSEFRNSCSANILTWEETFHRTIKKNRKVHNNAIVICFDFLSTVVVESFLARNKYTELNAQKNINMFEMEAGENNSANAIIET